MRNKEKELLSYLVDTIKKESYNELTDVLIRNINNFKYALEKTNKEINKNEWYQNENLLRDLYSKLELLIKLMDFIHYVSHLQVGVDDLEED